jgi:hypothetical protein
MDHMSDNPNGLLVFPYHVGPAIRRFGVALLWSGRLAVSLPVWPSCKPQEVFSSVGRYANRISHPLERLLATAWHHFGVASEQGVEELKRLTPLGDRLNGVILLAPGGRRPYDDWLPLHDKCLSTVAASFQNQSVMSAACTEFIWRVYELFHELDENPDRVLDYLTVRSESLGSAQHLLLEASLHRYCVGGLRFAELATDSPDVLAVLSDVGSSFEQMPEDDEVRVAQLAFSFFDVLLEGHVPLLDPQHLDSLLSILDMKADCINSAKSRCLAEARRLVVEGPKSDSREMVLESVNNLKEEVSEIVELDARTWKRFVGALSEDRVFWSSVLGLIGPLVVPIPSVVPAAAAITALSSIGTTAIKEMKLRRECLQKSPWSFVYHLRAKS